MTGALLRRHEGWPNLLKGKFYLEGYEAWCNKQNRCSAIVRAGKIKAESNSARYCRQQPQFKPNKSALSNGLQHIQVALACCESDYGKLLLKSIKIRMRSRKSQEVLERLYWSKKTHLKPHKRDLKPQLLIKLKITIDFYYSAMLKYSKSTKGAIITNSQSRR